MAVRDMRASISASHHIFSAPGSAGARADAEKGDEADDRVVGARRRQQPNQRGEDDERHDARLHQRDEVAEALETAPLPSNYAGNSR